MEPVQNLKGCSTGDELKQEKAENEGDKEKWTDMSLEEEDLIERLHRLLGERWGLIAGRLPNRKPEEVERYWRMKERMTKTKQRKASKQETRGSGEILKPKERMIESLGLSKRLANRCVKAKSSLKLAMIESIQDVEALKQKG